MPHKERPRTSWQPDEADGLFLQALLLPGAAGQAAWQAWSARAGLKAISPAAFRLLPELYAILVERGAPEAALAQLKSVARKTWYENQVRLTALADFISLLQAAGAVPLLLRGAIPAVQRDPYRNTSDMACAVPLEQAPAVFQALERAGWRTGSAAVARAELWRYLRGAVFRQATGQFHIELRWRLTPSPLAGEAECAIRQRSQAAQGFSSGVRAPSATDQLLLACLEGTCWRPAADWRWAMDAARLVNAQDIDWDGLLETCQQTACVPAVRAALAFQASSLGAQVPLSVQDRLAAARVSAGAARAFRLASRRPSLAASALRHWQEFRSLADGQAEPPWGFAEYLQAAWGLTAGRQVPGEAARRLIGLLALSRPSERARVELTAGGGPPAP